MAWKPIVGTDHLALIRQACNALYPAACGFAFTPTACPTHILTCDGGASAAEGGPGIQSSTREFLANSSAAGGEP